MVTSVNVSLEWILGILITINIIFLGWITKQILELKKDFEARIRFLENDNSSKIAKIELLEKIILKPFQKGEKENA